MCRGTCRVLRRQRWTRKTKEPGSVETVSDRVSPCQRRYRAYISVSDRVRACLKRHIFPLVYLSLLERILCYSSQSATMAGAATMPAADPLPVEAQQSLRSGKGTSADGNSGKGKSAAAQRQAALSTLPSEAFEIMKSSEQASREKLMALEEEEFDRVFEASKAHPLMEHYKKVQLKELELEAEDWGYGMDEELEDLLCFQMWSHVVEQRMPSGPGACGKGGGGSPAVQKGAEPNSVKGDGKSVVKGDGKSVMKGDGKSVMKGDGKSVMKGDGKSFVKGDGKSVVKGDGKSVMKGDGKSVMKGSGEVVVKGDGKSVVKGDGKSVVKGDGKSVMKGDCELVEKGDGKSVVKGDGKSVVKGDGKSVMKGDGKSVMKGSGEVVEKGDGKTVVKGDDKSVMKGDGKSVMKGDGKSVMIANWLRRAMASRSSRAMASRP